MVNHSRLQYFKTSPEIIRLSVMLDIQLARSLRNVEELPHERGVDVSHPAVGYRWHRFGSMFAAEIQKRRIEGTRSSRWRWHLQDIFVKLNGEVHYSWPAIGHESEVLESLLTKTRDKIAALKFATKTMRKLSQPERIVTNQRRFYGVALRQIDTSARQEIGRRADNEAKNSYLPFRTRDRGDAPLQAHA